MNNYAKRLINDPVINRLADVYLDFLGDCGSATYRTIKSAVIISLVIDDVQNVYSELALLQERTQEEVACTVSGFIQSLPKPVDQMFNDAYCADAVVGFMPHYKTAEDIIAFLGKTFLYILESNYPNS